MEALDPTGAPSIASSSPLSAVTRRVLLRGALPLTAINSSGCAFRVDALRNVDRVSLPRARDFPSFVGSIAWSPNGEAIAATSRSSPAAFMWQLGRDGVKTFDRPSTWPLFIGFSSGGAELITGADRIGRKPYSAAINVVDPHRGQTLRQLIVPQEDFAGRIRDMALTEDGQRLSCSFHGSRDVLVIETRSGEVLAKGTTGPLLAQSLACNKDGTRLAMGGFHTAGGLGSRRFPGASTAVVLLIDVSGQHLVEARRVSIEQPTDAIEAIDFSPDGRSIAVAGHSNEPDPRVTERPAADVDRVFLLSATTGERQQTFRWPKSKVEYLAYSGDGELLAALGYGLLTVVSTTSGSIVASRTLPGGVGGLAWHPSRVGRRLAFGSGTSIQIVDVAS